MKKYISLLAQCVLFNKLNEEEIDYVLDKIAYNIMEYQKNELIAIEGEYCHSLGIILSGRIEIQKVFPSGQTMTINIFREGNIFGESLVFTDKNTYPATITAIEHTQIMFIKKDDIIKLSMLDSRILVNFVSILSRRILMLNNRISNLSQDTIRKKICNYLLHEYQEQKTLFLTIPFSRKKMAELLNVPRPSLSRELSRMRDEGILDFHRNIIKILNLKLLEQSLYR
ncbi:MAG TPA: Crp/Fnr family transcriptional regulator [Tepidimicrobium sp.]|nr:Crp/Fnr family transcriptional regulator [Tepidimicrobium sp.]